MTLPYPWWSYFTIPWIAGVVGYGTNVVALWMTFWPIEFWGIELFRLKNEPWGLFGWQGIIPTKTEKMANISFDLFTKRLFNIKDIFNQLDPVLFSEVMSDSVLLLMDQVLNEVMNKYIPTLWNQIPKDVKDDIIITAEQEAHTFLSEFMKDMQIHIDDVVNIKRMSVSACVNNKRLMVQIFQECGEKEFIFIRRSGFYFGFLFGIIQMIIWFFYAEGWVLVFAGFMVGWITNYLALKIIFAPLEPKQLCGIKIHGLFLQRQKEVSTVFARVICSEIMNVKAIWDEVLNGDLSTNFYAMLRAHTLVFTEKLLVEIKPLIIASMGSNQFAQMKEDIAIQVMNGIPKIIDHSYQYTSESLNIENIVRTKMQELPAGEFEGVL